ncbi:MAG: hypothetical protein AB8B83_00320 [Bdellovibrionales bacterium]
MTERYDTFKLTGTPPDLQVAFFSKGNQAMQGRIQALAKQVFIHVDEGIPDNNIDIKKRALRKAGIDYQNAFGAPVKNHE